MASAVGLEPPTATSTLNDFLAGPGAAVPLIIAVASPSTSCSSGSSPPRGTSTSPAT
ncbi:hypothetical protein [Georgenia sp. SUBG003]|uniref:hypothetical protein n=1 Tax=Georgenia sp. SUBG003 TaxID=1497974 RepID=UPI003AB2506B